MSLQLAEEPLGQTLDAVPSTLLIPLAARALGDAMFPAKAVHDVYAAQALRSLDTDVSLFLDDRISVYGVLSRTRIFCDLARHFFSRFPDALGVNLGCGLSHYFQWLDQHTNHWLDADLPQVLALRKQLLPAGGKRLRHAEVDISQPGWWARLKLPRQRDGVPVLLICEGVLMYLEPAQVQSVLREFGENAPVGSELLCDTLCWMAVGCAALHPSVRHTQAQFRWGPRRLADFTAPHPRLVVRSEHAVTEGYDFSLSLIEASFRALYGVQMYGITRLEVSH